MKLRDFLETVDAGTWEHLKEFVKAVEQRVARDGETLGRVAEMLPAHRLADKAPPPRRDLAVSLRGVYEGVLRTLSTHLLTAVLATPGDDARDGNVTVSEEVIAAAWRRIGAQVLEDDTGLRGADLELAAKATRVAFGAAVGARGVTLDLGNGLVELRPVPGNGGGRILRDHVGDGDGAAD